MFTSFLGTSPWMARVLPFVIFLGLTALQGTAGEASRYWIYLAKTLLGVWMIWVMYPLVSEMRWQINVEGVLVGVAVFALWVGLDPYVPKLDALFVKLGLSQPKPGDLPWNPLTFFAGNAALGWLFVGVRAFGSALVVPPLEETFYRSFIYRYIVNPDFTSVSLQRWHPVSFFVCAALFGFSHNEWLAGVLCAMAYQALVLRRGRLGEAMTAHAVTNFLLAIWVVAKGAWQFW